MVMWPCKPVQKGGHGDSKKYGIPNIDMTRIKSILNQADKMCEFVIAESDIVEEGVCDL